jgi:GMP synthase-like glutamine amidotransferase
MATRILVIQNADGEGLGNFEAELKAADIEWDIIKAYEAQSFPTGIMLDEVGYRGLMILGGPMSALDDKGHPFLVEEVRLIQSFLERKLPMLNICLGAQLLARACNMPLTLAGEKEIGWHDVELIDWYTRRNPLFFQLPKQFKTFHWHTDTFEIPSDGYRLARSELYKNQAFCYGGNAYGIQFHPEMTKEMILAWIENDKLKRQRFITQEQEAQIMADLDTLVAEQKKITHKIMYGWVTLLRPKNYRRPVEAAKPVEVLPATDQPSELAEPAAS